jgi:YesN/AraC family two-component response regulator
LKELGFLTSQVGTISNFNTVQTLFNKIFVMTNLDEDEGRFISSNLLFELLVGLCLTSHNKPKLINSKQITLVNIVKDYIDNRYNQDITLSELSELIHVTSPYLCKIFKKVMNLRPYEYIALKRNQEAKILLSNTNMTVKDIAQQVGYHDCSYFCSMFKRYELISPSKFKGLKS